MRGSIVSFAFLVVLATFATSSLNAQSASCCEDYCYDTDNERPQSLHFGSTTAYDFVHGKQSVRQYVVPNCTPVKFWLLSRHGTRLPSEKGITKLRELSKIRDEIIRNYVERRTKPDAGPLCDEDLELLRYWKYDANITEDKANMLTTQGWEDIKYLAIHYQSAFPSLLENIYSPQKYQFKYLNSERTNASLKAFLEGLFGDHAYDHIVTPSPSKDDLLLHPSSMCPAYAKHASASYSEDSEFSKFKEGPLYQKVLADVSLRLGFKFTLKSSEIDAMFDACRYEQAWSLDRASTWCSAFTPSQVNILEYAEDLKYFYELGYGHPEVNSNIQCTAVSDMLRFLESKEQPKVSAYFTNSASIQLFLTALGAVKDVLPLRADNYAQVNRRKFKSSETIPFAANVAAIKYDCPNDNDRSKVMFFLNQKPLDFPFCNVGLCNWSDMKRMYAHFDGKDCAQTFCNYSGDSNIARVSVALLVVLSVVGRFL